MVYRYLQFLGFEVTYVRNITDIDDEIIKRSAEEIPTYSENPSAACQTLTKKYIQAFQEDMYRANQIPEIADGPKAKADLDNGFASLELLLPIIKTKLDELNQ